MKHNTIYGKYYVYEHILYGNIFWVGSGNWQRPYRFDNRSKLWWNYVKDRQSDVVVNIIKEFCTKKDAYNYEIEWSIKRRNEGYPIVGLIGKLRTEELKINQSNKMKGHKVSEETKEKIKIALSGKTRTLQQKQNISKGKKGKPSNMKGKHHTEEAKIKIGNAARGRKMSEETKKKISEAIKKRKGGNYMETAMTVKIYKIDYSFLIKNYLNPELWKKEWTLFAYKNIECTLQIYSIQTLDEKIRFQIRCYSHNLESKDLNNYCTNYIDCSLKVEDITFLKRQINSCIFNTMVSLEIVYYIRKTEEYEDMEERRYEERYRLKQYANEFLNECGVTSDACREAYIDAYVDENEQMYGLMDNWEDQQVYRHLTGMYLTFLDTLEDDPKKQIRTKEIENKLSSQELQEVQDEIKDFVIFMEDEENFEKELKSKLEEV